VTEAEAETVRNEHIVIVKSDQNQSVADVNGAKKGCGWRVKNGGQENSQGKRKKGGKSFLSPRGSKGVTKKGGQVRLELKKGGG